VISPVGRPESRTLKARYVFPVVADPIADGTVTIQGERIVGVGSGSAGPGTEDCGSVAILPGLVNAHTHLEFSDLASPLGQPGMGFVAWLEEVARVRGRDAGSRRRGVELGLAECLSSGVTAVGEIAQPGWEAKRFEKAPLEAMIFLELIAPTAPRVLAAWDLACEHLRGAGPGRRWHAGLSPHAPYSVHPALLARLVQELDLGHVPIAIHLAESREELELLRSGTGPFRKLLGGIEGWQADSIPPGSRPLDYLHALRAAQRLLVVHGNYLDDDEIGFLAGHRDRTAVVYCPRTHAYFAHDPHPLGKLLSAGVTVVLGTDGRASSPDLSILAEMRFLAQRGVLGGSELVEMGTLDAAWALGLDGQIGTLEPGKYADLAIVPLPDRDATDPYELLFDSDRPVQATWYRGRPRYKASGATV